METKKKLNFILDSNKKNFLNWLSEVFDLSLISFSTVKQNLIHHNNYNSSAIFYDTPLNGTENSKDDKFFLDNLSPNDCKIIYFFDPIYECYSPIRAKTKTIETSFKEYFIPIDNYVERIKKFFNLNSDNVKITIIINGSFFKIQKNQDGTKITLIDKHELRKYLESVGLLKYDIRFVILNPWTFNTIDKKKKYIEYYSKKFSRLFLAFNKIEYIDFVIIADDDNEKKKSSSIGKRSADRVVDFIF